MKKRILLVPILISLIAILILSLCCYFYLHKLTIPNHIIFSGTQYFRVFPLKSDSKSAFSIISIDGKEKIDVVEGKYKSGAKFIELRYYELVKNKWKQVCYTLNPQPLRKNDILKDISAMGYYIFEILDEKVDSIIYEDDNGKWVLPVYSINSRRFTAYYREEYLMHKYYQIYAMDKNGKVIWKQFSDQYWGKTK